MPMKLKDLILDRVDLVDKGANPDADIVLFKREDAKVEFKKIVSRIIKAAGDAVTFGDIVGTKEAAIEFYDVTDEVVGFAYALESSIFSILNDPDANRKELIEKSIEEFQKTLKAALDSWVDDLPFNKRLKWSEPMPAKKKEKGVNPLQKRLDALTKELADTKEVLAKRENELASTKQEDPIQQDVYKGMSDEARQHFAKLEKQNVTLAEAIMKMEEERAMKVCIEKATALKHLGTSTDDLASILKEVSDKAPDVADKLEALLSTASHNLAKSALFKSLGSNGEPVTGSDATARLDSIARALVKSGEEKSKNAAFVRAAQENPELYNKHVADHRTRSREA